MTITINICWIDKMRYRYGKHSDDFRRYFYLSLLFLSPLSLIFGIMLIIDGVLEIHHYYVPIPIIGLMAGGGSVGTIILSYLIINTFIELNNEHKWFALKRCEKEKKEN